LNYVVKVRALKFLAKLFRKDKFHFSLLRRDNRSVIKFYHLNDTFLLFRTISVSVCTYAKDLQYILG
jgi:hypothetical protein